jgi:hypothetical protein
MLWLLKAGGFPSLFIVLFGLTALIASALFLRKPERRRLDFIGFMSKAALFSVGVGICSDLAAVFITVTKTPAWANSPKLHLIVMKGLGESMAPGILGFTLLSLTAFITALGVRRMPESG